MRHARFTGTVSSSLWGTIPGLDLTAGAVATAVSHAWRDATAVPVTKRMASSFEGLTPDHVALILAAGFLCGTFPVYGCPTLLCLGAALALRLHVAALQVVNQIATPLQWALIVPLSRVGAQVLFVPPGWKLTGFVAQAVAGWLVVCVPSSVVIYGASLCLLRRRAG